MTARGKTHNSATGSSKLAPADTPARLDQSDPLLHALSVAPEDDEPFTVEDGAAIAQVEADRARGEFAIPLQEVMHKYRR